MNTSNAMTHTTSLHTRTHASGGVRLSLHNLGKRYGTRQVLQHTELHIEPGEFVAVVGRSGCGKSTLLRLIAGLEAPSQGALHIDGHAVQGLRQDTRIMFQEARLLPWQRVQDNVALGLPEAQRHAALVDSGYFVPHWPKPFGRGASAIEQLVIDEELHEKVDAAKAKGVRR